MWFSSAAASFPISAPSMLCLSFVRHSWSGTCNASASSPQNTKPRDLQLDVRSFCQICWLLCSDRNGCYDRDAMHYLLWLGCHNGQNFVSITSAGAVGADCGSEGGVTNT